MSNVSQGEGNSGFELHLYLLYRFHYRSQTSWTESRQNIGYRSLSGKSPPQDLCGRISQHHEILFGVIVLSG